MGKMKGGVKMKLKRLGVLSVAKLQAILMAVFGLILAILYAFAGTMIGVVYGSAGLGVGFGLFAIIIFPILYGLLGFISGAIIAFLYNLFAGWFGGVEMEFEK